MVAVPIFWPASLLWPISVSVSSPKLPKASSARSYMKFGERMLPGGDLYEKEEQWFKLVESRPENYAEEWLKTMDCPVIRVDGTKPVDVNIDYILEYIK